MGICDAPQWVLSTWVRSCQEAGATSSVDQIETVGERVLDRWTSPGRHYHTVRHLAEVLCHFDEIAHETARPALVRLAIYYHGAVFVADPVALASGRGGEDELSGAALAADDLPELGVSEAAVARVVDLITVIAGHVPPEKDTDAQALCDADLAVLASEPQRYKSYVMSLREEYRTVPLREFAETRLAILRHLAARPRLYSTSAAAMWEEHARQNIEAEIHRLDKELARLTLQDDLDEAALRAALRAEQQRDLVDPAAATS